MRLLEKLNRGGSKPGGFPLFSGKVHTASRTLSGLFNVGALNRPRERKRTNRENPGPSPSKSGNSRKIGKVPKRTKKEGQVQIGKPPCLKPPRLAALDPNSPKIEIIQDRPPGLKISSEIENFKQAAHQNLFFVGISEGQE